MHVSGIPETSNIYSKGPKILIKTMRVRTPVLNLDDSLFDLKEKEDKV